MDRRLLHRWGPLAAVAIVCGLPFWGLWRAPGPPMEEGFMLTFPELVLKGFVPHEDFLHLYGPGGLWVLAAVYEIVGVTLEAERAVGYLQQLAVAFGVFAALAPWGRWLAASGAVVAGVIVIPPIGLTALAWVGAIALGLWSVSATAAAVSGRRHRLAGVGGLLGGLALLYRPDLVVAVGLSGVVLFLALEPRARRWYVGGALAGVAPYAVLFATAGITTTVDGLFVEPVFELRAGRRLPLPPSWDAFDGFLQRAGLLAEPAWPFPALRSPVQLSLWLGLILVACALLFVAGRLAVRRTGDRRLIVLALFAAGLLPQAIQRADSTHLAWVSCVPFGLLPAAIAELIRGRGRVWIASLAVPAVMVTVIPDFTWRTYSDYVGQTFGYHRSSNTMRRGDRVFYYGRPDAVRAVNALLPVVDELTDEGDTLVVGTGDLRKTPYSEAFLYYLLPELDPGTRYIEMDPGVANAEDSGLAGELAAADIVILSSIRDDWVEPNDSRVFGPSEPNEVLAERFCLAASFGEGLFGRGLYEVYVPRRNPSCADGRR